MRKKSAKVLFWLNTGIFPATIMFSCGFEYNEIITLLKRKKAIDWLKGLEDEKILIDKGNYFGLYRELYNGKTNKSKHLFYIIIRERFTFTDYEMVKLAHECLHICQYFTPMAFDRLIEHECEAYLHSHIMEQCLKILRK